jgi:hypothetical protein
VVPGSQAAQGTPAEEKQQEEDHDINNEAEDDKEYSSLSDNEGGKLYSDADETESFGAASRHLLASFVPYWDTWASPPPQDTGSRESHVQGGWNSRKL